MSVSVQELFSYARHSRLDKLRSVLEEVDADTRDFAGNTVLIVAGQNGLKNVSKCAMRKGCDLNAQNNLGNTALHFCFAYGYAGDHAAQAAPRTLPAL
jgi:ankyrin repeat protein